MNKYDERDAGSVDPRSAASDNCALWGNFLFGLSWLEALSRIDETLHIHIDGLTGNLAHQYLSGDRKAAA